MAPFVDHYAALGIKPNANPTAIKKAFHQLALQHHPDKAEPGVKADPAKFISAQAAYEVLVDTTERKAYDIQYNKRSKISRSLRAAHKQATRVTRFFQRETDGSYGTSYGPEEMRGDEEDEDEAGDYDDYPPDTPSDRGSARCEDTGVYEDGYADPHYRPYRSSYGVVVGSSFHGFGVYAEDFDATDERHHFPGVYTEGFAPMQECHDDEEEDTDSEDDSDEEDAAHRISHPVTEGFNIFANMSKSHYLEEKVLGRYYKGALNELRTHKTECDNIDAQILDLATRVRRMVSDMPAGALNCAEFEEGLCRRLVVANGAVSKVREATDESLRVMRVAQQPRFWQLMDKRTWSVIDTLEKSIRHMEQMREVLPGLEELVTRMEGFNNEQMEEIKRALRNFMDELRGWPKEVTWH